MAFDARDYLMRQAVVSSDVYDQIMNDPTLMDETRFQLFYAIGQPVLGQLDWEPRIAPHRMVLVEIHSWSLLTPFRREAWFFDDAGHLQKVTTT